MIVIYFVIFFVSGGMLGATIFSDWTPSAEIVAASAIGGVMLGALANLEVRLLKHKNGEDHERTRTTPARR